MHAENDRSPAPGRGDAPTYVGELLQRALVSGLTDVYLVPGATGVDIRGRLASGEVSLLDRLETPFGTQCIARLKVLAGMLTYRTTSAQDGAIHAPPGGGEGEFRVASLPTRTGERLTVRVLRGRQGPPRLGELGFAPPAAEALRRLRRHPTGL